jgi:large subunit ribosomal protein L17
MRHRVAHRKLGRVTEHRIALLRNQASALLAHGRIKTTVPRGKELRPFVERLITIAKRSVVSGEDATITGVNARRMVAQDIADKGLVKRLFTEIAPKYADRKGGYTRLLRVGYRRGDGAELAEIELLGYEFDPNAEAKATKDAEAAEAAKPKKSVGGRIRQALGGGRAKADGGAAKVDKTAKGGKRVNTPRKAGGGS